MKTSALLAAVGAVGGAYAAMKIWPLFGSPSDEMEPSTPRNASAPDGSEGADCGLFTPVVTPPMSHCTPELQCAGYKMLSGTCVTPQVYAQFKADIAAQKNKEIAMRSALVVGGAALGWVAGRYI